MNLKSPKIVIVNGISCAGKDSFCDFCGTFCKTITVSTVDKVKEIAKDVFGWDGIKDEKGRRLLTEIREAWGKYNEGPLMHVFDTVRIGEPTDITFIMIREHTELLKAQALFISHGYTCLTLWVERKDNTPGPTEQRFLDMIPEGYNFDFVIHNDSDLEKLRFMALKLVGALKSL